jgi:hypothetical protein
VDEINNDDGAGAGSYLNTTDSQEAIRDRGDSAWAGAGGGGGGSVIISADYLGDFKLGETIEFTFQTADTITAPGDGIRVYNTADNSGPIIPSGATLDDDFATESNVQQVEIVLSDSVYDRKTNYHVVLSGATIGGATVTGIVGYFSIENRYEEPKYRQVAK